MKESVIKMVLDNNWADLNKYVESTAAKKIKSKIDQKKTDIVKAINEGSYLNSISAKNLKKGDIIYNFNGHKNVEVRDVYKQNHIINVYAKGIKNSKIYDENESVTLGDINEDSEQYKSDDDIEDEAEHAIFDDDLHLDRRTQILKSKERVNLYKVISKGNIELANKILDTGDVKPDETTLSYAVGSGNMDLVDRLLDMGVKPTTFLTLNKAALKGNLELINKFLDMGLKPNKDTLESAVRSQNIDAINRIVDAGVKPDDSILQSMKRSGVFLLDKWVSDYRRKHNLPMRSDGTW